MVDSLTISAAWISLVSEAILPPSGSAGQFIRFFKCHTTAFGERPYTETHNVEIYETKFKVHEPCACAAQRADIRNARARACRRRRVDAARADASRSRASRASNAGHVQQRTFNN